jgi:hypothetical protein
MTKAKWGIARDLFPGPKETIEDFVMETECPDKVEPDYEALLRMNQLAPDWATFLRNARPADLGHIEPAPETIADEAVGLVYGDRQASYGHPASDFQAMGRIMSAILSRWLESAGYTVIRKDDAPESSDAPVYIPDISPETVALLMTAVKLSRQSAQPKRDNLVDLIGYTLCAQRIIEGETS